MKEVEVYADWVGLSGPKKMGILRIERIRGQEVFSFSFEADWLGSPYAMDLDPDLQLFSGPQYLSDFKPNFGIFLDSSPDRWGRTLMEKRELINARDSGRKIEKLFESDFLLGIQDETRMGGIRFKMEGDGPFLADNSQFEVPPISYIRELEQASLQVEGEDFLSHTKSYKWLDKLLAPGSSLGGARPKANIKDVDDSLWIAKFPSKNDRIDSGAWEFLIHQMGKDFGLNMSMARAEKFFSKQHTFLTKRFDRTNQNERIHFASAMTLLGYQDGVNYLQGASYLELVEFLEKNGAEAHADIRELWKRVVFSVAVSNTDDHLRNHGFLLSPLGWKLSPAYDINPNPQGTELSLHISESDNSLDFDLCLQVAGYFRWDKKEAETCLRQCMDMRATWKNRAQKLGISRREQALLEPAFRHPYF